MCHGQTDKINHQYNFNSNQQTHFQLRYLTDGQTDKVNYRVASLLGMCYKIRVCRCI